MKNEDINALNQSIKQLAKKYNLTYIDLNTSFKNTEGSLRQDFSLDGIHLNGEGYLLFKNFYNPIYHKTLKNIHQQ